MNVTLESLTPEQKAKLKDEIRKEEKAKEKQVAEERRAYKQLVNETVPELFKRLKAVSDNLAEVKKQTFDGLKTLIKMKGEVYGRESDQYTHSFTTESGITLVIGCRMTDDWDDTVTVGVAKVDDFLKSLGTDETSEMLVRIIKRKLSKDAKGNLRPGAIIELKNEAEKHGDPSFIDAIKIIMDAYRPKKGREFVTCRWKDNEGKTLELPLDITAADMPEDSL